MKSAIAGLRTLLLARASLAALVGTRVYAETVPAGAALPYVVLRKLDADFNPTLDGTGGLIFEDFALDCKGATQQQAEGVAESIKGWFPDYGGAAGSVTIYAVVLTNESDDVESPTSAEEHARNVTRLEVQIQHSG